MASIDVYTISYWLLPLVVTGLHLCTYIMTIKGYVLFVITNIKAKGVIIIVVGLLLFAMIEVL